MFNRRTLFIIVSLIVGILLLRKTLENLDTILPAIHSGFTSDTLVLPIWIDYAAVFVFGITGTVTARLKGYDFVGAFVLAGITAMGGALLRDGLCIQTDISPLFSDSGYIISLTAAWLFGMYFGDFFMRFDNFIILCDAAGLGLYAVFGTNKALAYELGVPVAIGIGMINAVGGGLLRDIAARDEPMVFKPGQFYTGIAVIASALFVILYKTIPPTAAAFIVVVTTVICRMLVIRYNLHSQSVAETQDRFKRLLKAIREAHRNTDDEDDKKEEEQENSADYYDAPDSYEDDDVPEDDDLFPANSGGNTVDPGQKL